MRYWLECGTDGTQDLGIHPGEVSTPERQSQHCFNLSGSTQLTWHLTSMYLRPDLRDAYLRDYDWRPEMRPYFWNLTLDADLSPDLRPDLSPDLRHDMKLYLRPYLRPTYLKTRDLTWKLTQNNWLETWLDLTCLELRHDLTWLALRHNMKLYLRPDLRPDLRHDLRPDLRPASRSVWSNPLNMFMFAKTFLLPWTCSIQNWQVVLYVQEVVTHFIL